MTMKLKNYAMALMVGTGLMGVSAPAQASDLEISADLGGYSEYVWRSTAYSAGAQAVQGDFATSFNDNLSANVWYSNIVGAANGPATEFDYTIDYSGEYNDFGYSVGLIAYRFLNASPDNTLEVYVGASMDMLSATLYYDTDLFKKSMYLEVSAEMELAGFSTSATIGYVLPDVGTSEVSVITLTAGKDFEMGDVTVSPSFAYNIGSGPNAAVTNAAGYVTSGGDRIVAGVNFAY
ncbi:MAG: hypothetical protein L3J61_05770 [Ghiorsea sp.]|nr:hypothetical protein [Ghiorsea sp.]